MDFFQSGKVAGFGSVAGRRPRVEGARSGTSHALPLAGACGAEVVNVI